MILEELPGSTPRDQYEYLKQLQKQNINLYAKVEQAKTMCRGLLATPGIDELQNIIKANYETLCRE